MPSVIATIAEVIWQVLTPIFLIAAVGFVLARRAGLQPRGLSRATFFLFTPCLIFDRFSHTTLSASDLARLAAFVVLTIGGTTLLAWGLCRVLNYGRALTSAFLLVVLAGNTGNYGLPANQFAFGEAALEPAVIYFAISTLLLSTVGVYIAARGQRSPLMALRNALTVPLTYAGLAGLLVWATGFQVPLPIERGAALAGQAAVPVMLVLLGVQLSGVRLRDGLQPIGLAAITKVGAGAVLGFLLAGWLGLSGITRQAAILEASMPTAVMTTVLATEYDSEPQFTASVVLVSTLLSLVTVTLVVTYLR